MSENETFCECEKPEVPGIFVMPEDRCRTCGLKLRELKETDDEE